MKKAIGCALGLLMSVAVGVAPVAADHEPDQFGCPIHIDETSADNPNIVDPENDYNGVLTGNEGLLPWGDIYREGTDITKAWMHRDNATGDVTGVVEVVEIQHHQPNALFYLLWDHTAEGDDEATRWWASGRFGAVEPAFSYGKLSVSVTGDVLYETLGETTGRIEIGRPGRIIVDVPLELQGDPQPGDTLEDFGAESRILVGSPEPLPPPSPFRHGLVQEVDTTENAIELCDVYLNESA